MQLQPPGTMQLEATGMRRREIAKRLLPNVLWGKVPRP